MECGSLICATGLPDQADSEPDSAWIHLIMSCYLKDLPNIFYILMDVHHGLYAVVSAL